ncbi:MAG: 50S ribosomal protein L13 [Deferribacteraceae bacterium]|jgi:large subunit ribosomal protein L13|nr:50S ribosomal protein L13 [Deferribacteraceae bacterium]
MKTTTWAKPGTFEQKWYVIDAEDYVLGRMASKIAMMLMGKHKPIYTPFIDTGDYIVVVNAAKVQYTGAKARGKKYNWHTGYMGGIKERTLSDYLEKDPTEVIILAVKRMLPKTKMGRAMLDKLKVYAGAEHPHAAQKPEKLEKEA